MKVRATHDGVYAGYYRVEGEVFEIDEKPFVVKDQDGNPAFEYDEHGNKKFDGKGKPVIRMGTWFSKNWMEKVADDEEITNDYPPFQLPVPYRIGKKKPGEKAATPTLQPPLASVI